MKSVWYLDINIRSDNYGSVVSTVIDEHGIERHYHMEVDKDKEYISVHEVNSEGVLTMPLTVFDFMFCQLKAILEE